MGRNNHNAGMHFQRWSGVYGTFDDGRDIDRDNFRRINHHYKDVISIDLSNIISESNDYDITETCLYHSSLSQNIMTNIFLIALRNKIDIISIISDCEQIMQNCKHLFSWEVGKIQFGFPKLDEVAMFLSLLSEKLNCNVASFFIDDLRYADRFIMKLLTEDIPISIWNIKNWITEDDLCSDTLEMYSNGFYSAYGINTVNDENLSFCSRELCLRREKTYDNKYSYSISFGDLSINDKTTSRYIIPGAFLYTDKNGFLEYFFERLLETEFKNYKRKD